MKITSDLIRGHTDTIVLATLLEGKKYGYEIFKEILKKSGGKYELKEPTLYSSYKRLEDQGFIAGEWGDSDEDSRRKFYCITEAGHRKYLENKADWNYTKNIIDGLI